MVDERPPFALRPVHRWFLLWEDVVPSLYRVIAVAVAAAITGILLMLVTPVHWLGALLIAVAIWIAVAIVQELDGRVVLPVDEQFLSGLRTLVDPVLARAGFVFRNASGPARARSDRTDTFLYEADSSEGCIDLWIRRSRLPGGALQVQIDGRPLERILDSLGEMQSAESVTRSEDETADVAALVAAFEVLHRNDYFSRFDR
ncbi:MAG: hypothetical protein QNJ75_10200 [Acidimicrobiia bacterium]|nr:hypothetical protein [Acidimicrobiia bacterium]